MSLAVPAYFVAERLVIVPLPAAASRAWQHTVRHSIEEARVLWSPFEKAYYSGSYPGVSQQDPLLSRPVAAGKNLVPTAYTCHHLGYVLLGSVGWFATIASLSHHGVNRSETARDP